MQTRASDYPFAIASRHRVADSPSSPLLPLSPPLSHARMCKECNLDAREIKYAHPCM